MPQTEPRHRHAPSHVAAIAAPSSGAFVTNKDDPRVASKIAATATPPKGHIAKDFPFAKRYPYQP